jgi:hypothetical protein
VPDALRLRAATRCPVARRARGHTRGAAGERSAPYAPSPGGEHPAAGAEAPGILEVPVDDVGDGGAEHGTDQAAAGGRLTAEQFEHGLAMSLRLGGNLCGLRTLASSPDSPQYRDAAAAIYESAAEIPWLAWLLEPQSVWLQRIIAVGAWAVPVAIGVRGELSENRRQAAAAARAARASSSSSAAQASEGVHQARPD